MSPTFKFSRGRGAGVERDLPASLGPLAGLELERAELRLGRVVAECELGRAVGPDGLAVAPVDLGLVGLDRRDRAACLGDLGERADTRDQRLGNRRGSALGALDDLLAGDDRVGLLIRRGEDAVERLLDRVGQDERAADHRDADHDRERGQQRTDLAPQEALQRDSGHR